jgi:hypothetical protein
MNRFIPLLFLLAWLAWVLYWWLQSRSAKTNVWAESVRSRLMHVVPLAVAVLLIALPALPVLGLDRRFLPWSPAIAWVGFLVTAAGLGFTVWARRHLGTNWSGDVTLKENHELITSSRTGGCDIRSRGSGAQRFEVRGDGAHLIVREVLEHLVHDRRGAQAALNNQSLLY